MTVNDALAQAGLINPPPETLMEKFGKTRLLSWLPKMGDLFETLPKVATYKYLREYNKKTPRDAAPSRSATTPAHRTLDGPAFTHPLPNQWCRSSTYSRRA